jgi:hypothetical protein
MADRYITDRLEDIERLLQAHGTLSGADISSLISMVRHLNDRANTAQDLCNRWIEAALKLDVPSGGALAFDPTNPEAFTASRAPVLLDLIERASHSQGAVPPLASEESR